jgi:hypothetical protein
MQRDESISEAALDRLVDGELTADEERQLLGALDDSPDGWRRCALAFVEARTWRRELAAFSSRTSWRDAEMLLTDVDRGRGWEPSASRSNQRVRSHRFAVVVLAASMLLALAAGSLTVHSFRQRGVTAAPKQIVDVEPGVSTVANESGRPDWPEVMDSSEVITMVVQTPDGSTRSVLVPLLDAEEMNRLVGGVTEAGIGPALPAPLRHRLERSGFRIEQQRRYAPVSIGGQRMIVPVEDTEIIPVQYRVY